MGLIIDTNVFIDAENGRLDLSILSGLSAHGDAFIAAVTVSELLVGVHMAKTADIRIRRSAFVEGIIKHIPIMEFSMSVARTYGELYSHFLKPRNKSAKNVHDLQIAATAIAHGFAVLTSNVEDFEKVPGLKVVKPNSKNK
ncbi:type II toxin-antitoxin system VapC family toxin [Spartinivicinus poritis]|uniref:Type II toxin-antitoxin system VapC family toxin n=1 Tax=Spartinivicinus poritis TaxID=2994640 RepID=A0ABT5UHN9_9GAMM|nr:type II toxin-antitoxin system VapC family toxin [Spartinivicinus sp. A2-2]MDE1465918.1 type II toxin-antitoxin system VapC family toxin [Spartinivicinus sp. A2-2]